MLIGKKWDGKSMRPICIICGKSEQTIWWVIERWWLRLTEKSLLWENCCSEKCYMKLLKGILNNKYKIVVRNNIAILDEIK